MKKTASIVLAMAVALGSLVGCSNGTGTGSGAEQVDTTVPQSTEKLVIYSPNTEEYINLLIPMFEKETGIKVEITAAGGGELFKRLQSEKENPSADLMLGGGYGAYMANIDLFEPYVSKYDADVPEQYRNTKGFTICGFDPSCILINTDLIGDIKIESYEDLLNPALKGKIATADPTNSGSAYEWLQCMIMAMGDGDYQSEEGWNYIKDLFTNIDGKIAGSSSACHKSVADGEYVVGLTYEDPSLSYVRSGAPVEVVFPKEGIIFTVAGSGIVKDAPNMENAKKFIDFLLSPEAQNAIGQNLTHRPVRSDASLSDVYTPLSEINVLHHDLDMLAEVKPEIIERYTEIVTTID